jgi:hypothetical protein
MERKMRTGKLALRGAVVALVAAGAAALSVSPASARLICNQYGKCYWTHNGDYVPSRYENRQYENQWNVRIHGAGRHYNNDYRDHNRGYDNDYDRHHHDYDHDGDRDNDNY